MLTIPLRDNVHRYRHEPCEKARRRASRKREVPHAISLTCRGEKYNPRARYSFTHMEMGWWELSMRIWFGALGVFAAYAGMTATTVRNARSRSNPRPVRWHDRLLFAGAGLAFLAIAIFGSRRGFR